MARIAVLGNINLDPLKQHLLRCGFSDLYFGGYDQWQPELLNGESGLYAFGPDYVFIYLNAEDLRQDIGALFAAIDKFAATHVKTHFLVANFCHPPFLVTTYADRDPDPDAELNEALRTFAAENTHTLIFDVNRVIRLHGYQTLFDDKYWYLGRIRHSGQGFKVMANELKNVIAGISGLSRKVLVLDLDNTLWGGVAGEEGWEQIQLSPEGQGRVFFDFQQKIRELQKTGVLLATCSKNNEEDIREVFSRNRWMQLGWDDFILHKINWDLKTDNLVRIAETLDLGLDSMVFIDDNPVERELVRQTLPDVAVPDFPADISLLNRWFVTDVVYPWFPKRRLTGEDMEKTGQYKRKVNRDLAGKQLDYDQFIEHLQIRLTVFRPAEGAFPRIAQLTQKTNQFNLTGHRYSDLEIKAFSTSPEHVVLGCEYEDVFGHEGVVGCVIIRMDGRKALLDTFLLSCRVLGRKAEFLFMDQILAELKKLGVTRVEAIYNATPRNVVARDFYPLCGFKETEPGQFFIELRQD